MKTISLKNICTGAGVVFALLALTGCPSGDSTKKAVSTVTKKTVETAKGVFSGIAEGVDDGRKQTTGVDGATVVTTFAEMQGKVGCEILGMEEHTDNGAFVLTLGLANGTDTPIRVSGLAASDQVMVIDKTGYVSRVQSGPMDVTIPAKAKEKANFMFKGKVADYVTLRILGGDLPIAGVPVTQKKAAQE